MRVLFGLFLSSVVPHLLAQEIVLEDVTVAGGATTGIELGQPAPALSVARWLTPPPADAQPKLQLLGVYSGHNGAFLDDASALADLHKRHAEAGLQIRVVVPMAPADAAAEALLAAGRGFAVGIDHEGRTAAAWGHSMPDVAPLSLVDDEGNVVWRGRAGEGLVDVLPLALADKLQPAREQQVLALRTMLTADFENAGDQCDAITRALADRPHDGQLHGLLFLSLLWHRADPAAASAAIEPSLQALGTEAMPLAAFADLVLRGERHDRTMAVPLAMAMTVAAAAARDSAFVQTAYLRALLRAGRDREAAKVAQVLPKLLAGRAREQVIFVETLGEAGNAAMFADLAERALADAASDVTVARWAFAARYKLALASGAPDKAEAILAEYRNSEVEKFGLNNDAWYIATELATLGRFDALGLAQAEQMRKEEGDQLDYNSMDTLALLLFLNGKVDEAVELQAKATEQAQGSPQFQQRLQRYQRTQERLRAAKAK